MKNLKRPFLALSMVSFLCSCGTTPSVAVKKIVPNVFDTAVTIYQNDGNTTCANAVAVEIEGLDNMLDAYHPTNSSYPNIYDINHTNATLTVSQNMADLLTFMLDMQGKTQGYFNPLMGNLTALWKAGLQAETPYVPNLTLVNQAVADIADTSTNYLEINGTSVTRHGVCTIDVGALCKGWALKSIEHVFKDNNSTDFIVDGGTSSFLFGYNKNSSEKDGTTKITIDGENGRYMRLKDTGLGTSGTSEQNATIDGVFYSHIVNPFTGSAIPKTKLSGAVGADPAVCDVLSTTFFLCGLEKTKEFAATFNVGYFYDDGTTFSSGNGLEIYGG